MDKVSVHLGVSCGKETFSDKLVQTGSAFILVIGLFTFIVKAILSFHDGDFAQGSGCIAMSLLTTWSLLGIK